MLVSDYLKQKNKILKDYIGLQFDLVPEDQMQECRQFKLRGNKLRTCSHPYCEDYGFKDSETCAKCPLNNSDYKFSDESCSDIVIKYEKYCKDNGILEHTQKLSPAFEHINKLVEQYNYELEHNINTNNNEGLNMAKPNRDSDILRKLRLITKHSCILIYDFEIKLGSDKSKYEFDDTSKVIPYGPNREKIKSFEMAIDEAFEHIKSTNECCC